MIPLGKSGNVAACSLQLALNQTKKNSGVWRTMHPSTLHLHKLVHFIHTSIEKLRAPTAKVTIWPRSECCELVTVNRLINWYEVFCRFTGFKWPPPSQLPTCANCMTTCKWMVASPGRISNQSCLRCVETLRSRNGRQRSKEAAQSVRYAGRRLPMAEAQPIWRTTFARSIVWCTYDKCNSDSDRVHLKPWFDLQR